MKAYKIRWKEYVTNECETIVLASSKEEALLKFKHGDTGEIDTIDCTANGIDILNVEED